LVRNPPNVQAKCKPTQQFKYEKFYEIPPKMNSQFTTISLGDRPFLKMFETTNIQTMNMRFSKISLLCGYLPLKEGIEGVGG
jgi:hypothetical protein